MDRKCIKRIICVGQQPGLEADSPVTNYSSEYNDGVEFASRRFPPFPPYDPGLDSWVSTACSGSYLCTSHISQEDADDCAAALAIVCVLSPHPPTDPTPFCISNPTACIPPSTGMYTNDEQSAEHTCPDGTVFTWTVNAGTIISSSKSLANQIALALAQQRVGERFICFNSIQDYACLEGAYSQTIQASGSDIYTMEITAGAIPDGMVSSPGVSEITISGTPTGIGVYYFTVRATGITTDAVSERTYVISTIGIVTASVLSNGIVDQAYSEQLTGAGGTAPYTYAIVSGALPAGLSLTSSGLIDGKPTAEETQIFTVELTDSNGSKCSKSFSIQVEASAFDWSNLSWYYLDINSGGPGSITANSNPASVPKVQNFFSGDVNVSGGFATTCVITARATISYKGPLRACAFNASFAQMISPDAFGQANWFLRVSGYFPVVTLGNVGGPASYPFNLPDTGGLTKTVTIEFEVNGISFGAPQEIAAVVGSFS